MSSRIGPNLQSTCLNNKDLICYLECDLEPPDEPPRIPNYWENLWQVIESNESREELIVELSLSQGKVVEQKAEHLGSHANIFHFLSEFLDLHGKRNCLGN